MDTNLIALALKKIGGDRDAVGPGKYSGEALVRIAFDLTVGQDYQQRIVSKVPWMKIAAVLLDKVNGATIDAVLREAMLLTDDDVEALGTKASEAMATLVEPTTTECAGKVTGAARIVEVVS